jgi:hypothetical protein
MVIIFTRHELTAEQSAILDRGYWVDPSAHETLTHYAAADRIIDRWVEFMREHALTAIDIYGVFPPILRHQLAVTHSVMYSNPKAVMITVHEAHNVNRAPEGERPQFQFVEWLYTGHFFV